METTSSLRKDNNTASFRDAVATISKEGHRNFIQPKQPKGRHYHIRTLFSIFYLLVFFTLPFIKVNDNPLLLLNVLERKFIIFGLIFWPQDFFIFGIAMLTFIVFVILFTVVFGRVFCGWACPQTIFMEMVFRKIEYWIDGDSSKQKQLRNMPWTAEKIGKRSLKFIIFYGLSFVIANFFLAYLVGMDQLLQYVSHPAQSVGTLVSLMLFTTVFFFVYWWFREQACIVVCPYGRLQGVLLDKNAIVVAYDYLRGEPRGKQNKKKTAAAENDDNCKCKDCKGDGACKDLENKLAAFTPPVYNGDCIDCQACIRVCPTGIDIRNGTQLECINCTACIDACNEVMTKLQRPKGLIRYASEQTIKEGKRLSLTWRIKAYSAVLLLLLATLITLIATRKDLDARVMRIAGMTYTSLPDGRIANLYQLKLANKTHKDIPIVLKLENGNGEISPVGSSTWIVPKEAYANMQFFVKLNRNDMPGWKKNIAIGLYQNNKKLKTINASFIGPEVYD
jgi:polyferredoxin